MTLKTAQKKLSAYLTGGGARMEEVDGKHVYNGNLPSTSEILRVFSFGEFPNMEKMEEAAHIGTAVHGSIAVMIMGGEYIVDDMIADDIRYHNCIKAFQEWRKDKEIIPVAIEQSFASTKHGFGGTIDFVGIENKEVVLKDWKTGQTRYKDFVQLELYAMLLKECTGLVAKDLCLVYLNKETGEFKERRCPDRQKLRIFSKRVLKFWKETEEFKKLVDGRRRLVV